MSWPSCGLQCKTIYKKIEKLPFLLPHIQYSEEQTSFVMVSGSVDPMVFLVDEGRIVILGPGLTGPTASVLSDFVLGLNHTVSLDYSIWSSETLC